MSANNYQAEELIDRPQLVLLPDIRIEEYVKLAEFGGKRNALLQTTEGSTFLGLDTKLMMSEDLTTWKTVLETEKPKNIFWHMVEARDGTLFVQEYGISTGIYRSTDGGETWKQITSDKQIDKKARHFHSLAYDPYRDLLIVTLGDWNIVKVAISDNYGDTWKPVYSSPYQCLPIVVSKDYVVFGMDSAISRGVIVWNPAGNKWQPIHLKYVGKLRTIDDMQSSDLKLISNGVWLMSTGRGSLLSSNDLRNWHMLRPGEKQLFETHMISNERNGIVTVAVGDAVIVIDLKALNTRYQHADVRQYHAFFPRMKGLGSVVKRRIETH